MFVLKGNVTSHKSAEMSYIIVTITKEFNRKKEMYAKCKNETLPVIKKRKI